MMRSTKYRRNQFRIDNDSLGFDLQHTLGVAGQNCEITVIIESALVNLKKNNEHIYKMDMCSKR
ncbi:hypothetical protein EXW38_29025 (plasmid) [Bacillus mycoides]|uniref:hypothetical protein n=1 Tax=Bacillus mycoides TaxID=1405 RepID=UPI001C020DCB|nr:hypothetical protein [Bacillus mycoides]QWH15284.1 hypothetical protein EXW38_29025 [Bacillus mycoides]